MCATRRSEGMKAKDEKEPGGDRWPFQTMRNSGDKGGVCEREWEGQKRGMERVARREKEKVRRRAKGR